MFLYKSKRMNPSKAYRDLATKKLKMVDIRLTTTINKNIHAAMQKCGGNLRLSAR